MGHRMKCGQHSTALPQEEHDCGSLHPGPLCTSCGPWPSDFPFLFCEVGLMGASTAWDC